METAILTLRVPLEVKDQLGKLAEATHRSQSFLGSEAIRRYIDPLPPEELEESE